MIAVKAMAGANAAKELGFHKACVAGSKEPTKCLVGCLLHGSKNHGHA